MRTWIAALLAALAAGSAKAEQTVDLELVLAIDSSNSVSASEWGLQVNGYAAAFRDPRVQAALASGPNGRIGVSVIVWADAGETHRESPWFVLATPADGERFAAFIPEFGRGVFGETGIGAGIAAALHKMKRSRFTAARRVIDVSGDGRESPSRSSAALPLARELARRNGVTVNGLAILNDDPELDRWYREHVIEGPGAFVTTAADYADFARAIVRKLLREIEHKERLSLR